ncbi:hypothetical protein [Pararhodospirillum photometricum]|nr:hypothetical protein [Pararhodospirillum photometricum]
MILAVVLVLGPLVAHGLWLWGRRQPAREVREPEPVGDEEAPALLGRGERPFAFASLQEARRAQCRLPAGTGVLYCDGFHFLTEGRVRDRDRARTYIRRVYALRPGDEGRPLLLVGGQAGLEASPTRLAWRSHTPDPASVATARSRAVASLGV